MKGGVYRMLTKHGGLDRLFQFPYVSRPVMGQQPFLRLRIETFYLSAMLLVVKFPEEFSKRQDVFRAFPERGYFHGVLTQSEIQEIERAHV